MRAQSRGRWRAALDQARESVALGRELLGGAMLANNLGFMVQIEAGLGHVQPARDHAAEALELCQALSLGAVAPHALQGLGLLDLSLGDYESTIRHAAQIDPAVAAGWTEPGARLGHAGVIEAHVHLGHLGRCPRSPRRARVLVKRHRTLARARARRPLSWPDQPRRRNRKTLRTGTRLAPKRRPAVRAARTQLCYGERLRRAQHRSAARRQLANAHDTFQALHAPIWSHRAEAELAAAGERAQEAKPAAGWEELTVSERRVAQLIIDGATYQEAADQLFLSTRTIETHLRQTYRKLGVRSRTELTRRLTRTSASDL